jgi:hypothetical protein
VQGLAVLTLVTTPLWSETSLELADWDSVSGNTSVGTLKAELLSPEESLDSLNGGEVVTLISPELKLGEAIETKRLKTKQVRFQIATSESLLPQPFKAPRIRDIASLKNFSNQLSKISKLSDGLWVDIPLVRNEAGVNIGSSFVELEAGVNQFRVFYALENGKSVERKLKLIVE